MKPIKMLGLAVMAALLAMAFASSAMANGPTSLCKTDEEPCKAANQVSHVHEKSVGLAVLLSSETVECEAEFLGDTIKNAKGESLGQPLQILGAFTYPKCNGGCTAKEENGPTEIQVLRTGTELASVTSGSGTWAGLVNVVCTIFKISCKYVGTNLVGTAQGPLHQVQLLNGDVELSGQVVVEEGNKSLCPDSGELDITTTPLEKIYIST